MSIINSPELMVFSSSGGVNQVYLQWIVSPIYLMTCYRSLQTKGLCLYNLQCVTMVTVDQHVCGNTLTLRNCHCPPPCTLWPWSRCCELARPGWAGSRWEVRRVPQPDAGSGSCWAGLEDLRHTKHTNNKYIILHANLVEYFISLNNIMANLVSLLKSTF